MKKLLYVLGGLIVVIVVAGAIFISTFDPNEYKPQISGAVKDATGRDLTIAGDIGWKIFPSFGLALSQVSLSNPEGFSQPEMATLNSLSVSVAVMPLLSGNLKVDSVSLDDVNLNLITLKDGTNNLSDLTQSDGAEENAENTEKAASSPLNSIELGKITINNVDVKISNQQAGTEQKITLEQLVLSKFVPGERSDASMKLQIVADGTQVNVETDAAITIAKAFDVIELHALELQAQLQGPSIPNGKMVKRIAGHGLIDLNGPSVDLKDIEIDVESLKGTGWFKLQQAAVPDIQFALAFDTLNVDDFVDDSASKTKESDNQSSEPTNPDAEPDLTVLNSFNVDGDLTFSKVLAAGLTVSNVKLHANLKNGKLVANPLHADLYQGTLDSKVTLNAQAPVSSYTVGVNLKGVEAQPMLTDLAEFEMLSGNANFEMTVRGKGLSTNKLKAGSAGAGKFWFADGAVHGVNVAQMIRSAKSMLKGESGESEVKKTDFSELSGSFTLAKGLVTNPDLKLSSPLLRVDGKGTFDVIKSYIDYAATTELVATSKGQGGKEANDLAGIKIPLKISGTPDDLKYGLDMEAALKGDLEEKLEKEKEKGIEKLSEKLGGFLGGL